MNREYRIRLQVAALNVGFVERLQPRGGSLNLKNKL